ncbi:MAG: hypothetical protein LBE17_07710 [Treponema sp.]|nr:hypothetical protein [Treponema sp.]
MRTNLFSDVDYIARMSMRASTGSGLPQEAGFHGKRASTGSGLPQEASWGSRKESGYCLLPKGIKVRGNGDAALQKTNARWGVSRAGALNILREQPPQVPLPPPAATTPRQTSS